MTIFERARADARVAACGAVTLMTLNAAFSGCSDQSPEKASRTTVEAASKCYDRAWRTPICPDTNAPFLKGLVDAKFVPDTEEQPAPSETGAYYFEGDPATYQYSAFRAQAVTMGKDEHLESQRILRIDTIGANGQPEYKTPTDRIFHTDGCWQEDWDWAKKTTDFHLNEESVQVHGLPGFACLNALHVPGGPGSAGLDDYTVMVAWDDPAHDITHTVAYLVRREASIPAAENERPTIDEVVAAINEWSIDLQQATWADETTG